VLLETALRTGKEGTYFFLYSKIPSNLIDIYTNTILSIVGHFKFVYGASDHVMTSHNDKLKIIVSEVNLF
jgi:hypothetical protein